MVGVCVQIRFFLVWSKWIEIINAKKKKKPTDLKIQNKNKYQMNLNVDAIVILIAPIIVFACVKMKYSWVYYYWNKFIQIISQFRVFLCLFALWWHCICLFYNLFIDFHYYCVCVYIEFYTIEKKIDLFDWKMFDNNMNLHQTW